MSEAIEETGSLSEHEAQHYPNPARAVEPVADPAQARAQGADKAPEIGDKTPENDEKPQQEEARARDESGKFTKHRPKSQEASKEDVPRIKELTKRLREAEERAADFERRYSERAIPAQQDQRAVERPSSASAQNTFSEPEPTIEQFEKEADPYAAWIRAVNRYDRKKEAFESEQQRLAGERQRVEADGQAYVTNLRTKYAEKAEAFAASHADYNELLQQYGDWDLPGLANAVILEHENGPQLVYNLLKKPEELAGLILLTDGKPVNEKTVALATRWLENRALDAQTGSPAPVVNRKPTPTPPNPVRTVPSGSPDSDDDVESMSLSSFEKKFAKGRR